jgi:DNA-binding LytR/AlgR family response regulator
MKILIVEHEDLARETLYDELSHLAFVDSIQSAASEQAAEEILSFFRPDIVLLDMQLPGFGAFRIADRIWPWGVPVIVCTTTFERSLLEALNRYRVEYLVRPFGAEELVYVITRGRRRDPIDPLENQKRLLDAAIFLQYPVRGRICAYRQGRSVILSSNDIAAIRHDRGRLHLWTQSGVFETARPVDEIERAIGFSSFRRVYQNGLISMDRKRFGRDLDRARQWLRWHGLIDLILNRRPMPWIPSQTGAGSHPV